MDEAEVQREIYQLLEIKLTNFLSLESTKSLQVELRQLEEL